MSKRAFIIGAQKNIEPDCSRWDPFIDKGGFPGVTEWRGAPAYITRDLRFNEAELAEQTDEELLSTTLDAYHAEYKRLMAGWGEFAWVVLDRETTHGLMISPPLRFECPRAWNLASRGLLTDVDQKKGLFEKHVLCLLFGHLCHLLPDNGHLVFDVSHLEEQHVRYLSQHFNDIAPFGVASADKAGLAYDSAYTRQHNRRFLQFSGLKQKPDLDALKDALKKCASVESLEELPVPKVSLKVASESLPLKAKPALAKRSACRLALPITGLVVFSSGMIAGGVVLLAEKVTSTVFSSVAIAAFACLMLAILSGVYLALPSDCSRKPRRLRPAKSKKLAPAPGPSL